MYYAPPDGPVTIYAASTVYRPSGWSNYLSLISIHPVQGVDPLDDPDVLALAIHRDLEEWDETKYGPYEHARLIGHGVARMVPKLSEQQ